MKLWEKCVVVFGIIAGLGLLLLEDFSAWGQADKSGITLLTITHGGQDDAIPDGEDVDPGAFTAGSPTGDLDTPYDFQLMKLQITVPSDIPGCEEGSYPVSLELPEGVMLLDEGGTHAIETFTFEETTLVQIKATQPSTQLREIEITATVEGCEALDDVVNATAVILDLDAHWPGTMAKPGRPVSDAEEDDPLKLWTSVNDDDDNIDAIIDNDREHSPTVISNDDELVTIVLRKFVSPLAGDGLLELSASEELRLFTAEGTQQLTLPLTLNLAAPEGPLADVVTHDLTFLVEATEKSVDAVIRLRYLHNGHVVVHDEVHCVILAPKVIGSFTMGSIHSSQAIRMTGRWMTAGTLYAHQPLRTFLQPSFSEDLASLPDTTVMTYRRLTEEDLTLLRSGGDVSRAGMISGTRMTRAYVGGIAALFNALADLFGISPEEPYTGDIVAEGLAQGFSLTKAEILSGTYFATQALSEPGDYQIWYFNTVSGEPVQETDEPFRTERLVVVQTRIQEVSFDGEGQHDLARVLTQDKYYDCTRPHWNDLDLDGKTETRPYPDDPLHEANDRRFPVAFVRDAPIEISPTVVVNALPFGSQQDLWLRGTLTADESPDPLATLTFSPAGLEMSEEPGGFRVNATTGAAYTPGSRVTRFVPLRITWELSLDGGAHWFLAGASEHPAYVLWNTPEVSETHPLYHSLVHLGCGAVEAYREEGHSVQTDDDVLAAIWQQVFEKNARNPSLDKVKRVTSDGEEEQPPLTYHGRFETTETYPVKNTHELVFHGDGICDAWAKFFLDTLKAQGLRYDTYLVRLWFPYSDIKKSRFLVANWTFQGEGTEPGSAPYRYPLIPGNPDIALHPGEIPDFSFQWKAPVEIIDEDGIQAQGVANPDSVFAYHVIVSISPEKEGYSIQRVHYDPSYGRKVSQLAEMRNIIAGYGYFEEGFLSDKYVFKPGSNHKLELEREPIKY